jgi:hypothetical protein
LIDPDFQEIGASGRLWSRPETIAALSGEPADGEQIEATEFQVTAVTVDVVLVTFLTVSRGRRARRTSLWRRTGGRWLVLQHQGTPLAP